MNPEVNYTRKINIEDALGIVAKIAGFKTHRFGWRFALSSLKPLHVEGGVALDGGIENTFFWDRLRNNGDESGTGWDKPWIGFVHYPPNYPDWCKPEETLTHALLTDAWRKSLEHCRGLFCLSEYSRTWLADRVDVPVDALLHPTGTPDTTFSFESFVANNDKSMVVVGNLLRKLYTIYLLRITKLRKVILATDKRYVFMRLARELQHYGVAVDYKSVEIKPYLPNSGYDEFLSKNIVFIDLYDSSANNTIIECIVRHTPVLVNPLPAVREYLGEAYPFYFESLEEAASKAEDFERINTTHEYLKSWSIREKLKPYYFLKSFAQSEIYRRLPEHDSSFPGP